MDAVLVLGLDRHPAGVPLLAARPRALGLGQCPRAPRLRNPSVRQPAHLRRLRPARLRVGCPVRHRQDEGRLHSRRRHDGRHAGHDGRPLQAHGARVHALVRPAPRPCDGGEGPGAGAQLGADRPGGRRARRRDRGDPHATRKVMGRAPRRVLRVHGGLTPLRGLLVSGLDQGRARHHTAWRIRRLGPSTRHRRRVPRANAAHRLQKLNSEARPAPASSALRNYRRRGARAVAPMSCVGAFAGARTT